MKTEMKTIDLTKSTAADVDAFLSDALAKEIVAVYNNHADKPVKAFNTRGISTERLRALADQVRLPEFALEPQPEPATKPGKAVKEPKVKAIKEPKVKAVEEPLSPEDEAILEKRRAASTKSWADPDVAARRSARHAVRVDGVEYGSTRKAFTALNLPIAKMIKFRIRLKAEGKLNEFNHKWEAIEA